jgi:hypothetical protein
VFATAQGVREWLAAASRLGDWPPFEHRETRRDAATDRTGPNDLHRR